MALSNLFGWSQMAAAAPTSACGSACGASEKPAEPAAACGAPAPEEKPAACGAACGAGDKYVAHGHGKGPQGPFPNPPKSDCVTFAGDAACCSARAYLPFLLTFSGLLCGRLLFHL
jgi:ACGX-repeat protein